MTHSPGGRKLTNQRACPKLFACANGKYLFWFHNHSQTSFFYRNPAWLVGGVVRDGKMHWSKPEIVLFHHDLPADDQRFHGSPMKLRGMSYPDLIEQDEHRYSKQRSKPAEPSHRASHASNCCIAARRSTPYSGRNGPLSAT